MIDRSKLPHGTIPAGEPPDYLEYHRLSGYALDVEHHDPVAQRVKTKLLAAGGWSVVIPLGAGIGELAHEVETGGLQRFTVRFALHLDEHLTHASACFLFLLDPKRMALGTGYALCADGIWRSHFWAVRLENKGGILYETAEPRELYHGLQLTGAAAQRIAEIETATMNLRGKRLPTFDAYVEPRRTLF